MKPRRVGISLGNIGALHDGLGEFSLQIGQRVATAAPAWREQFGIAFDFHLREELFGLFGTDVGYLAVNRWQRLRHVQPAPYALWHSLHQLNKNLPPRDCGTRVVTVHDLNYLYGRNAFSTWRHQRRTRALMRRTDVVAGGHPQRRAQLRRCTAPSAARLGRTADDAVPVPPEPHVAFEESAGHHRPGAVVARDDLRALRPAQ